MNPDHFCTYNTLKSPDCGPSNETGAFISEHYIIDAMGRYIAYIVYENAVRIITWMEDIEEWGTPSTYFDKDEARKAYVHAVENGAKEVDLNTADLKKPVSKSLREYKEKVVARQKQKMLGRESYDQYVQEHMKDMMEEALERYTKEDVRSTYDNYALKA